MPHTIVLDTSPLATVTKRRGNTEADACRDWIGACRLAGARVVVPSIAYYEVARELTRLENDAGMNRLDAFCNVQDRYLTLTDSALRLAVRLWAGARRAGTPTADPKALDGDVLIAAQALDLGLTDSEFVVATFNVRHLSLFVPCGLWTDISP